MTVVFFSCDKAWWCACRTGCNAQDTVKPKAQQGERTEQKTAKITVVYIQSDIWMYRTDGMLREPAHMYCFVCSLLDRFHHQEC